MTIRHTLLMSYLLISLASALFITITTFVHFREMLRLEIENKLKSQASAIMQQIDTELFERFENMTLWSGLEIMQEMRVRDVDKRLANYLNNLHDGYGGIYRQLFVVDSHDEIISACDAALIGQHYRAGEPWLQAAYKNRTHTLQHLDAKTGLLYFSTPIKNSFGSGELGRLYAGFDWQEITALLDAPLPFSSKDSPSYVLLVDNGGTIIATSSGLSDKSPQFQELAKHLPTIIDTNKMGAVNGNAGLYGHETVLVGYAVSQGYRTFKGFGWHVLILQPSKNALAPVWDLWMAILILLGLALMLGIFVSFWMSAKIARPIAKLAEFTRDFMQGKQSTPPQIKSSSEITELSRQFSLMIDNLEQSKHDLVRASKLAVIGEMAATMAHEVRTPLGILRSSAQILQREPQLSDIGKEMTEFILSETQRLNGLITTLLECAKPRQPEFSKQDLHPVIAHATELLQHQADNKRVKLMLRLDAGDSLLEFDHDLIIQVFLNLIMNAIQHVEFGGLVEIATQASAIGLEIMVSDDGAGISDANKAKIFEPFFTQRQDGIGLGLTVVQQIVSAHHGQIFVTDSHFGGACFHIILPISLTKLMDHA